jgi:vacuolar iron transporter family protein
MRHYERHRNDRIGWLRAAVMGANDGIVSTASLVLGVAAAGGDRSSLLVAGVAGLVAGAMSMAAGEYVSVSSQADTEGADIARETRELGQDRDAEHAELAGIYLSRGLAPELAAQVASALMAHDALGAHLRDELGIVEHQRARPLQAALSSCLAFAAGAALPLGVLALAPAGRLQVAVITSSLLLLAVLGGLSARIGGARASTGALRVGFWGAMAMAATSAIGALFHTAV